MGKVKYWLIGGALLLVFFLRSPVLWQPSISSYGYDYGFYLYALRHNIFSAWGEYGNPLFYFANLWHVEPGAFLTWSLLLWTVGLALALYGYFVKSNKTAGMWSIVLLALSAPQIEAYSLFLWKNLLALVFLILSFKFLQERKWAWWGIMSILVVTTHRTTAVVYGATLAAYGLLKQIRNRQYKLVLLEIMAVAVAAVAVWPQLSNFLNAFLNYPNPAVAQGIFLSQTNILQVVWPYLILAGFGAYYWTKNKQPALVSVFAVLTAAWILFRLPFSNRIILYFDLALIIYAAYFFGSFRPGKNWKTVLSILVLAFAAYNAIHFVSAKTPLVTQEQISEIRYVTHSRPGSFVLALDAQDAPWLLGYSQGVRLAAPGLFEDGHSFAEWQAFWAGQNQKEFLSHYPKPLLIYSPAFQLGGQAAACWQKITTNFYQYMCD